MYRFFFQTKRNQHLMLRIDVFVIGHAQGVGGLAHQVKEFGAEPAPEQAAAQAPPEEEPRNDQAAAHQACPKETPRRAGGVDGKRAAGQKAGKEHQSGEKRSCQSGQGKRQAQAKNARQEEFQIMYIPAIKYKVC